MECGSVVKPYIRNRRPRICFAEGVYANPSAIDHLGDMKTVNYPRSSHESPVSQPGDPQLINIQALIDILTPHASARRIRFDVCRFRGCLDVGASHRPDINVDGRDVR